MSNGSNITAFEKHNHLKEKVHHKGNSIYIVHNYMNTSTMQLIKISLSCCRARFAKSIT